jgi:hypothetical protein
MADAGLSVTAVKVLWRKTTGSYHARWLWSALTHTPQLAGGLWALAAAGAIGVVFAILTTRTGDDPMTNALAFLGNLFVATLVVLCFLFLIQIVWFTPRRLDASTRKLAVEPLSARERAETERDEARAELNVLRERLKPTFRPRPEAVNAGGSRRLSAFLEVTNVSDGEAKNCRGRLISLGFVGGFGLRAVDIPLAWAQPDSPSDPSRKSFYGSARLNVAVEATPNHMAPAAARPLDDIDRGRSELSRDVDLLLRIELTADGVAPTVGLFRLKWYSSIRLPSADPDVITERILSDARIEFEGIELHDSEQRRPLASFRA